MKCSTGSFVEVGGALIVLCARAGLWPRRDIPRALAFRKMRQMSNKVKA